MRQLKITYQITDHDSVSIERYFQEIGKIELSTPDEDADLARKIRAGDQNALERLCKAHSRFVVSVAKQYQSQKKMFELNDLINEGNIGLIKAAHRFDETRGFKFISYAVNWIRQSILQALADESRIVRLPVNKLAYLSRMEKVNDEFQQEHYRKPVDEELQDVLPRLGQKHIPYMKQAWKKHTSINTPVHRNDENSLTILDSQVGMDEEEAFADVKKEDMSDAVHFVLSKISSRKREMVKLFYGIGQEFPLHIDEIASRFGIKAGRAKQIIDEAVLELREHKIAWLKEHL